MRLRILSVSLRLSLLVVLLAPGFVQGAVADLDVPTLKKLSLEELMSIEVTSVSLRAEKLAGAASAIQVVTSDDIRRSGATTLPEALRLAGNLNISQKNAHDWAISARGFNSNLGNKMLVLVDGRSVYTPLFAGVFWSAQNYLLEDVDQIEAISGPGGTLWGANAVNGVINITTKGAADTQGTYLSAATGDELQRFFGARYGGQLAPEVFFRIYAKYLGFDSSTLPGGQAAHDAWAQGQTGFRLDAKTPASDRVTLQGDFYSSALDFIDGEAARIGGANVLGRWTRTLANASDLSIQAYFDRTHLRDPFGASPFAPAGFLIDDLDTYDLSLRHRLPAAGQHTIVWGGGYRLLRDNVRQGAPNFTFVPAQRDQSLGNVFVQDEIALTSQVAVIVGAKLEHNDYTGFEIEPNVRARWRIADDQLLWAAVSRAVRTPTRFDRDLAEPAPPTVLISGGSAFESETLIAYELGYRATLGSALSGSLSFFYHDYDRLRGLAVTPVTFVPLVYRNSLEADSYGAELSAEYRPGDRWRLRAGYAYLESDVRVKPGQSDFFNALDETADPRHQLSLHTSVDVTPQLEFDSGLRWVDTLRVNAGGAPAAVPSYWELDLRLGWRFNDTFELSLVGHNLLHAHHPEFGPPNATRAELDRSIFVKAECRF